MRPRLRLVMGLLASASMVAGTARGAATDILVKSAPGLLTIDCPPPNNTFPNQGAPGGPYLYYVGSTITWTIELDFDRATDVVGGVFDDLIDDDHIQLLCDPGTYSLPAGATLTRCDPGSGPPADGRITISNITVPARTPVSFTYQTRMLGSTLPDQEIYNLATFDSTPTGHLESRRNRFGQPGVSAVVMALAAGFIPTPLNTVKKVVDLDGGDVMPGDTLEYHLSLSFVSCPDDPPIAVECIDPVPSQLQFLGITTCDGGSAGPDAYLCTWDGARRQLTFANPQEHLSNRWPARMVYQVRVDPAVPGGTRICNQAVTNGSERSDDPDDPSPDAPTCVTVVTATTVSLDMLKSVYELDDDDGYLEQGERVRFELQLRNPGRVTIFDGHLRDVLPVGLTGFDPASVTVSPRYGNNQSQPPPAGSGAGIVEWDGLRIPAHGVVTVAFDATIGASFSGQLCNSATLSSAAHTLSLPSDDPATTLLDDPTCRTVVPPRFVLRQRHARRLRGTELVQPHLVPLRPAAEAPLPMVTSPEWAP